jgi:hypothetical protein
VEYGSGNCKDIQKKLLGRSYKLYCPSEFEAFEKAGAHSGICASIIGNGAKWTVEIMMEEL